MRILVAEDDESWGNELCVSLTQSGHTVDWFKEGSSADQALRTDNFDVVILNAELPKQSGLEVLENFRGRGEVTPVIIVSAYGSISDKIKAFDSGADDYLIKPVNVDELCARLRALQRRFSDRAELTLSHGHVMLDPASHTVTLNKEPVEISRREFALLHKLLENVGRVLSRDSLIRSLYGWDKEVASNTLEVHIHNLRKKLGQDFILTLRGVGYIINKK
ncbi:MAG: qseB [Gammaproteobacteria bacterium]|jgi:two-component system response regulator QseB|nr:qseB [Gammaproteobacteria bacterium]